MSLILEALNRSQRERQADADTPGLDTPVYLDEDGPNRRWLSYLPWIALLVALAIIALLVAEKHKAVAPPVASTAQISLLPHKSRVTQPDNASSPAATQPTVEQRVAEVPPVESPLRETEVVRAPTMPMNTPETTAASSAVVSLYGDAEVETPDQLRTEEAIDIEEVLARTKEELKNVHLAEHPAPFISELSQQAKDEIPSILYSQHDYTSRAKQSSVILNGKKVKAGGSVAGSIRLEEILPNSIVLSYRGMQFRLRALNSWVNL